MGNVQLRYETMQTAGLVEAIETIPRYDISVTNDGQSSLEKMGLAPIHLWQASGLSAGPRGQAECLLPKQRGLLGWIPIFIVPSSVLEGSESSSNQCRNCNATPIRQEQKKSETKFCAVLILDWHLNISLAFCHSVGFPLQLLGRCSCYFPGISSPLS